MYKRYKESSLQSLTVNQHIAAILKDINKKLQESDRLFRTYKMAESLEIGKKAIYKSIALADIMDEYINQTLEQPNHNNDVKSGLKDLQRHFDSLHKMINQYVVSRDGTSLERIVKNLGAMEKFWAELTPIPENND